MKRVDEDKVTLDAPPPVKPEDNSAAKAQAQGDISLEVSLEETADGGWMIAVDGKMLGLKVTTREEGELISRWAKSCFNPLMEHIFKSRKFETSLQAVTAKRAEAKLAETLAGMAKGIMKTYPGSKTAQSIYMAMANMVNEIMNRKVKSTGLVLPPAEMRRQADRELDI